MKYRVIIDDLQFTSDFSYGGLKACQKFIETFGGHNTTYKIEVVSDKSGIKLIDLLNILTPRAEGVKLFSNQIAVDDNMIFKGSISELANLKGYHSKEVFQIITCDYERYVDIILI